MAISPLPPLDDMAIFKRRLYQEHHVEVPIIKWNGRVFVRVSVQGYNNQGDIDRLLGGLRILLGRRT
jgi:selenocysteine lyase/cysteine desulfurase